MVVIDIIFIRHDTKQYDNMKLGPRGPSKERPLLDPSLLQSSKDLNQLKYNNVYETIKSFELNKSKDVVVFCSPFIRAIQTYDRFNEFIPELSLYKCQFNIDADIRSYTGNQTKNAKAILKTPIYNVITPTLANYINYPYDIFESMDNFEARIDRFINRILDNYSDSINYVFSHSFLISKIISKLKRNFTIKVYSTNIDHSFEQLECTYIKIVI